MLPVTARWRSLPLGATALADGVNFALLCRHGTKVRLVLLPPEGADVWQEIDLDLAMRYQRGDSIMKQTGMVQRRPAPKWVHLSEQSCPVTA
jgi:hypothetical protein